MVLELEMSRLLEEIILVFTKFRISSFKAYEITATMTK